MITVFTPTYNRAHTLRRLYDSLCRQTYHNFEWIIVDDGSNDDTRQLCESFKQDLQFPLHYYYQKNQGKHVAINTGAKEAQGEWFFMVDSDDYLVPDSLELSDRYLQQVLDDDTYAGVAGWKTSPDGNPLMGWGTTSKTQLSKTVRERYEVEYIDATPYDYRHKYDIQGDRSEVIRTELVRKYPFPRFEGENFMTENWLWQSVSNEGLKLRWFNRGTMVCEYLDDGLTQNAQENLKRCWRGRMLVDNLILGSRNVWLRDRARSAVDLMRYGRCNGLSFQEIWHDSNDRLLVILGLPIALVMLLKDD